MKKSGLTILLTICTLATAQKISDTITNTSDRDMLCVADYPAVYRKMEINGTVRYTRVKDKEERIKIIHPSQSFKKERKGFLVCYNELGKISSDPKNRIEKSNEYTLESYLTFQNEYDIFLYQGEDLNFTSHHFGIPQRCAPYKGGRYCDQGFGLDVIYDRNEKVKTVLLYDTAVKRGTLPFEPESILHLRSNNLPLGLWIQKKYKKYFSKKPSVHTKNLIMWENLTPHIKRVIMTPKRGHYELGYTVKNGHNSFVDVKKGTEEPRDYLQAVEVQYR